MKIFTITIHNEAVIKKLESLDKKKGKYISKLIEHEIRLEEMERRLTEIEIKCAKEDKFSNSIKDCDPTSRA